MSEAFNEALIGAAIALSPWIAGVIVLLVLIYWLGAKWGDAEAERAEKEFQEQQRELWLNQAERENIERRIRESEGE